MVRSAAQGMTRSISTGKSFLTTAIEYQACQEGYWIMYVNTAKLMGQLKLTKAKGTVLSDLKRIERMDVLILDDFGLQPFDSQSRIAPCGMRSKTGTRSALRSSLRKSS